jgi:hypothetical protein
LKNAYRIINFYIEVWNNYFAFNLGITRDAQNLIDKIELNKEDKTGRGKNKKAELLTTKDRIKIIKKAINKER